MKTDIYIPWIKEVNIELTKYNICLSCFNNIGSDLERWFEDQFTPEEAALELHFKNSAKRENCVCLEKGIKNPASSIEDIIKNAKV